MGDFTKNIASGSSLAELVHLFLEIIVLADQIRGLLSGRLQLVILDAV